MKSRIIFFLKYCTIWLVILLLFKLTFIIYHADKFRQVGFVDFVLIFVYGLKLDISLEAYMVTIPVLSFVFFFWSKKHLEFKIIRIYTLIILMIITLLNIIDLALYSYWNYRLDYTVLNYIDTPGEMLANLRWYHYFILVGALIFSWLIFYRGVFAKLFRKADSLPGEGGWKSGLVFLLILGALIIPIRGGLGTASLNVGAVYFHKRAIVNHAAINPVWNFVFSLTEKQDMEYKIEFFSPEKEEKILEPLKVTKAESRKILKTDRPNIIMIILESFTAFTIERNGGRGDIAPNLNKLIKEGVYFDNFYGSGDASAAGLGALLSGYPSLPNSYILKFESKVENIPGICKDLSALGYTNRFFYGGDINFAHIHSFLIHNQFDDIVSLKDFPDTERISSWGVPDHFVFNRLLEVSSSSETPFCHVLFTLSSHAPFDVPMDPVFEGSTKDIKFFNSLYYTDKSLGKFIRSAEHQPWWDSTLIFVMADHGAVYGDVTNHERRRFHIPMLMLGGALNARDTIISKYGNQIDVPAILFGQMGIDAGDYRFSRDLLADDSLSFTYYAYHMGMGYLDDTSYVVYDLSSSRFIVEEGAVNDNIRDRVKALLQNLWTDFANR